MPVNDRGRNVIDGTYVNAPDLHQIQPSRNIGLREYNNGVLVHNWFEERTPYEKTLHKSNSSYRLDYKPYPDATPDVVLRRKLITTFDGKGTKHLIGMHNFDSSKNMITLYDETINKRTRPGPQIPEGQQFPDKRKWKITEDAWVPEKSDFPLQDEPTKWGLLDKKRQEKAKEDDKYASRQANLSEYTDRYQKHPDELYKNRTHPGGISKDLSTSFYETNITHNKTPKARSTSSSLREPQARDVMEVEYNKMFARSFKYPRTYRYLGKIPGDGELDQFSMRNFETLTPKYEPSLIENSKN